MESDTAFILFYMGFIGFLLVLINFGLNNVLAEGSNFIPPNPINLDNELIIDFLGYELDVSFLNNLNLVLQNVIFFASIMAISYTGWFILGLCIFTPLTMTFFYCLIKVLRGGIV